MSQWPHEALRGGDSPIIRREVNASAPHMACSVEGLLQRK
jgi:hypothetical protein